MSHESVLYLLLIVRTVYKNFFTEQKYAKNMLKPSESNWMQTTCELGRKSIKKVH